MNQSHLQLHLEVFYHTQVAFGLFGSIRGPQRMYQVQYSKFPIVGCELLITAAPFSMQNSVCQERSKLKVSVSRNGPYAFPSVVRSSECRFETEYSEI